MSKDQTWPEYLRGLSDDDLWALARQPQPFDSTQAILKEIARRERAKGQQS